MNPDDLNKLATRLRQPEIEETMLPDGSGVLLDIQGHQVLSLSKTAVFLVKEIRNHPRSTDELASRLCERFEVSNETAKSDVDAFAHRLLEALTPTQPKNP